MIIGRDFVWVHFPKAAGVAVTEILKEAIGHRPDVHIDVKDYSNPIWHQSVEQRAEMDPSFSIEGKRVICCYRPLPEWMISRVYFEFQRNPGYIATRDQIMRGRFIESHGGEGYADAYMKKFTRTMPDAWIRTKHLREDAIAAFAGTSVEAEIRAADWSKRENVGKMNSIRDVNHHFTHEDRLALYRACPTWAEVHRQIMRQSSPVSVPAL